MRRTGLAMHDSHCWISSALSVRPRSTAMLSLRKRESGIRSRRATRPNSSPCQHRAERRLVSLYSPSVVLRLLTPSSGVWPAGLATSDVCHIASFQCDAEFGHHRRTADIDQAAPSPRFRNTHPSPDWRSPIGLVEFSHLSEIVHLYLAAPKTWEDTMPDLYVLVHGAANLACPP